MDYKASSWLAADISQITSNLKTSLNDIITNIRHFDAIRD